MRPGTCYQAMEKQFGSASWASVGKVLDMRGIPLLHPPMSVCPISPRGKIQSVVVNSESWETASYLLYTVMKLRCPSFW